MSDEVTVESTAPTHPRQGCSITERNKATFKKRFDKWVESHPPFREIPDEYIPEDEFSETPLFLWGLPFSQEQALAYAIRYNLRCKDGHPCFLPNRVIDHLANKRDFVLDCRNPLSQVHKNLVVLYTNFNMLWRHLSLEQEEEIIEVLREELGIPMEVQPLWYWDKDTCGPSSGWESTAKYYKRWIVPPPF